MHEEFSQKTPTSRLAVLIVFIILMFLLGILIGYYFNQQKQTESSTQISTTPTATTSTSQTTDWKTYTNDQYGFSFKYPNYITINNSSDTKKPQLSITVEELNKIGDQPMNDDYDHAIQDIEAIKKNDLSTKVGAWFLNDSVQKLNIANAVGKKFTIMQSTTACNVQLTEESRIYNDKVRIILTYSYLPKDQLTANNPTYFQTDQACIYDGLNGLVWKNPAQFYNDLIASKTDSSTQTWYQNFSTMLSSFQFTK